MPSPRTLAGVIALLAVLPAAEDHDPRVSLHVATAGYLERLQATRETYLTEGRAAIESQGEYLLTIAAHTHADEPGTSGLPLRTEFTYTLANTIGHPSTGIGLQLRAYTHREPRMEVEEAWTEDLGGGRFRQKWMVTEWVEEPENVEELYLGARGAWVRRIKQHALQFVLLRGDAAVEFALPNLSTMREDDVPNEVHRHFGLLGPAVLDVVWPESLRAQRRATGH